MARNIEINIDQQIAIISLNGERALNALTIRLAQEITEDLVELDLRDDVIGIVLTGEGERAFCAGVDLREAREVEVHEIEKWFCTICNIYKQIILTNKPVIAAINGIAAGGGFQIALASDQRVATHGIKMGQPEINAGIPSIMRSYWMSLHLSLSKNQELSMSGRLINATEAQNLGIVNYLVDRTQLLSRACEIAHSFATKPAIAWSRTKAQFREIALEGFDEAFKAGVLGQQEAYSRGQPQAKIDAFFSDRSKNY